MDNRELPPPSYDAVKSRQSDNHPTQHNNHHSDNTRVDGDSDLDEGRGNRQSECSELLPSYEAATSTPSNNGQTRGNNGHPDQTSSTDCSEPLLPSYSAATSSQTYNGPSQQNIHQSDNTDYSNGDRGLGGDRGRRQSGISQEDNESRLNRCENRVVNRMRQQPELPRYGRGDPSYECNGLQQTNRPIIDDDGGLVPLVPASAGPPVGVHFQSNLPSSSQSGVVKWQCGVPPVPSMWNGPYLDGKLRPEYRHMSGPPYPPLHLMRSQVSHPADNQNNQSCQEKPSTSADHGARPVNAMQVEQFGQVTRVTYHPDQPSVTYIDNLDGEYGYDYMGLSILNMCCCVCIGGMIGLILSFTTKHLVESGDARKSRILGRITFLWNIASMVASLIVFLIILVRFYDFNIM